jgi:hypothetical protein
MTMDSSSKFQERIIRFLALFQLLLNFATDEPQVGNLKHGQLPWPSFKGGANEPGGKLHSEEANPGTTNMLWECLAPMAG